jgi:hypothetical protein
VYALVEPARSGDHLRLCGLVHRSRYARREDFVLERTVAEVNAVAGDLRDSSSMAGEANVLRHA